MFSSFLAALAFHTTTAQPYKMSKVNSALKQIRASFASTTYGIVSGNQSGDLDSVVSAISYAYLSHKQNPQRPLLPVLNFTRAELSARKDIVHAFQSTGLDAEQLYYADDLASLKPSELILVDHNSPQGKVAQLPLTVTGIIDHHDDEGLFKKAEPRIIEKCGSCSSLVAKYWTDRGVTLDNDIVRLLLAPLVIDTRNLTSRVEEKDVEASKLYKELIQESQFSSFFKELQEAKEDISGLSAKEILAKDFKFFEFGVGSAEISKSVGFSSIVKPFEWLLKEHPDFKKQMESYLKDLSLDILVIMTSFEKDEKFSRELCIISNDDSDSLLVRLAFSSYLNKELELELQEDNGSGFEIYNQLNIAASRKQVAPALKKALERL